MMAGNEAVSIEMIPTALRGPNPPPTNGVFIPYGTLENYYFNICKHEMEKFVILAEFIEQLIIHSGNVDVGKLISTDWHPSFLQIPSVINPNAANSPARAATQIKKGRKRGAKRAGNAVSR